MYEKRVCFSQNGTKDLWKTRLYSSEFKISPRVGLYFGLFFFVLGISRTVAFGDPITFRAASFNAFEALNTFFFCFAAISFASRLRC